jgi:hypothetical protein
VPVHKLSHLEHRDNLLAVEYRQESFVCADVALFLGILELVFADVLPKAFWSVRSGGVGLCRPAASAASGCTGLLRAFLGEAAFFGVAIGQLERAGLGSQAKNQPCFSGSRERLGESQPIVLGLFIRELIPLGNTHDPTSQVSAPSGPSGSPRGSGWHESCITST